jgi:hypothetical protein
LWRKERDDWRLPEIEKAINKAIEAYLKGNAEEAKPYRTAAITVALQSPYLTVQDRRRVTQAIIDELKGYEAYDQGAVPDEQDGLNGIMRRRAVPLVEALSKRPLSLSEALAMADS